MNKLCVESFYNDSDKNYYIKITDDFLATELSISHLVLNFQVIAIKIEHFIVFKLTKSN